MVSVNVGTAVKIGEKAFANNKNLVEFYGHYVKEFGEKTFEKTPVKKMYLSSENVVFEDVKSNKQDSKNIEIFNKEIPEFVDVKGRKNSSEIDEDLRAKNRKNLIADRLYGSAEQTLSAVA